MFWETFVKLCNEKNIKPTNVALELGFSKGSVTNWKKGATPQEAKLYQIAKYFDVSVPYLKGEEKEKASDIEPNAIILDNQKVYMIPIYESVSAGFGAYPDNNVIDYMPIYFLSKSEAEKTICVKVKGDSMSPKIESGDIIQVLKTDTINNGKIGVVLIEGDEALVKEIHYGYNWIELRSINKDYKTIRFEGSEIQHIKIIGLVTKIVKEV